MYVTLKNGHKLIEPTDEEDAAITAAAMSDPDARPLTDEEWERVKHTVRIGAPLGVAASFAPPVKRSVGRPKLENPSEKVTMRIAPVTLAHLRGTCAALARAGKRASTMSCAKRWLAVGCNTRFNNARSVRARKARGIMPACQNNLRKRSA